MAIAGKQEPGLWMRLPHLSKCFDQMPLAFFRYKDADAAKQELMVLDSPVASGATPSFRRGGGISTPSFTMEIRSGTIPQSVRLSATFLLLARNRSTAA